MISKKGLIVLTAVIALIGIGICFALSYTPPVDTNINKVPDDKMTSVVVYEKDVNTLKEINVKLYNEEYTFTLVNGVFVNKNQPDAVLNVDLVNQLASDVSVMVAKEITEQNATDYEKYGLDAPKAIISAVFNDETKVIKIGGQTAKSAYFMCVEGDTNVYIIYMARGDSLLKSFNEYRDYNILKVSDTHLKKVKITDENKALSIEKIDGKWYVMPIKREIDENTLGNKILSYIGYFNEAKFADAHKDYAKYGLENPLKKVYLEDENGTKQAFNIGTTEGGTTYAKLDGMNAVLEVSSDILTLFNVKDVELADTFVLNPLPNIKDVKKITVTKKNDTFTLERNQTLNEIVYKLNGEEINRDKHKQIYSSLISVLMTDFCDIAYNTDVYCKIAYEYLDLSKEEYEYAAYSNRQLVVYKNKKSLGYVQKSSIDNLISMFK